MRICRMIGTVFLDAAPEVFYLDGIGSDETSFVKEIREYIPLRLTEAIALVKSLRRGEETECVPEMEKTDAFRNWLTSQKVPFTAQPGCDCVEWKREECPMLLAETVDKLLRAAQRDGYDGTQDKFSIPEYRLTVFSSDNIDPRLIEDISRIADCKPEIDARGDIIWKTIYSQTDKKEIRKRLKAEKNANFLMKQMDDYYVLIAE